MTNLVTGALGSALLPVALLALAEEPFGIWNLALGGRDGTAVVELNARAPGGRAARTKRILHVDGQPARLAISDRRLRLTVSGIRGGALRPRDPRPLRSDFGREHPLPPRAGLWLDGRPLAAGGEIAAGLRAAIDGEDPAVGPIATVRFVPIPGGTFTMGCVPTDPDCLRTERPAHLVSLSRGFELATTESTNAQYRACVAAGACAPPARLEAFASPALADHPVTHVSWHDAAEFCAWAGGRLPSEAEWERAARGGREGEIYPWGSEPPVCIPGAPNGAQFGAEGGCPWAPPYTRSVASFAPNPFGLYDMAGNVQEWVADVFDGTAYRPDRPAVEPQGPSDAGRSHVLRGGSWGSDRWALRSSQRSWGDVGRGGAAVGFRCARALPGARAVP